MKILATMTRTLFAAILLLTSLLPFAPSFGRGDRVRASDLPIAPPLLVPRDDCLPRDPPPPTLKIKVRVPACSAPGRTLEYRICIENCSPAEAHHVVVKDL